MKGNESGQVQAEEQTYLCDEGTFSPRHEENIGETLRWTQGERDEGWRLLIMV